MSRAEHFGQATRGYQNTWPHAVHLGSISFCSRRPSQYGLASGVIGFGSGRSMSMGLLSLSGVPEASSRSGRCQEDWPFPGGPGRGTVASSPRSVASWSETGMLVAVIEVRPLEGYRLFSSEPSPGPFRLPLRQSQHALAEDVALDLARPGRDRVLAGGHETVEPARGVGHQLGALVDQRVHAQQLARRIRDAHADLGAGQLEDRALGPGRLAADLAGERPGARVLHRLAVDVELREPLAGARVVPGRAAIQRQSPGDGDERPHLADRVAGARG